MEYILSANGLYKSYKNFKALNGLSMNVPKGAIYGFVGKNGAGKTTLIRIICGLQEPTSGDGVDELLKLVGLEDTGKKKAKNFSLGMRQRLAIAIALAGDPDFLVLDEPVNGLDPQGIVEIRELILKLNQQRQITVLISSHILDELSRLATHYGFIDSGRMVREISARELEEACRKCVRVEVSDTEAFARVLDRLKIEYNIVSDTVADIFDQINITKLVMALAEERCEVISAYEKIVIGKLYAFKKVKDLLVLHDFHGDTGSYRTHRSVLSGAEVRVL